MRSLVIIALFPLALFAQSKDTPSAVKPLVKPEVHLNHAFIVPDAETYEAIRDSDFVKQFAVWEERTTKRKDITYTGFYLYGRHTYFEFLKPDERNPVGASKIGFGVDRTGDLDLLQKRAEAAGIKTEIKTITRSFKGKDVDWFRSLEPKEESDSPLSIWTLEYVPTFLNEWNPKPGEKSSVRREDVLKRYAEVVKQKQRTKMLADLTMIVVQLPESGLRASRRECDVLGWSNAHLGEPPILIHSRDAVIQLRKGEESAIQCVMFKLRRRVPYREHSLGKTKVYLKGDEAVWEFKPPANPSSSCRALLAPH